LKRVATRPTVASETRNALAGFGGPREGPLGACDAAGSGSYLEVTRGSESLRLLASTDPGIVSWKDVRIVAALPRDVPPPGPPQALAVDPAGRVWFNSEFDHTLKFFDPSRRPPRERPP
jgi:hypothetical protein